MALFNNTFEIFGLTIHYYGIITALGYILGVVVACLFAKKRGFKTDDIITVACYVIPLAVIGARLCYVLNYLDKMDSFWDAFAVWDGGLVFYGGLIGGILGVVLYCLIHKKNFLKLADIAVVGLIIGQGLGRWGNFVNQEAYGYEVTDPKWQFFPIAVYIDKYGINEWHLATFFYEFMNNMIIFVILALLISNKKLKYDGIVAAVYLILYGFCRYFVEGLRTDSVMIGDLRFSQVLSIVFMVIGFCYIIGCVIYHYYKKKHRTSYEIIMDVLKDDLK